MSALRRVCLIVTAAPVLMVSCVDLSTLAQQPGADAGADDDADAGASLPSDTKCPPNQKSCAGGCVPTDAPEWGCAADSCDRCSVPFAATVICENGKCAAGTCTLGRGSCDGMKENGCEANLATAATCGSCTSSCPIVAPFCSSGACVEDCPPGATKCGSQCVAPPGTSLVAGDCLDTNPNVKPGQAAFFFTGYTSAAGTFSYDYDCNGNEERDPTKPVGACTFCRVGDYLKVSRTSAPPVSDLYCGSTVHITGCSASACSTTSASGVGCR